MKHVPLLVGGVCICFKAKYSNKVSQDLALKRHVPIIGSTGENKLSRSVTVWLHAGCCGAVKISVLTRLVRLILGIFVKLSSRLEERRWKEMHIYVGRSISKSDLVHIGA